MLNKEVLAPEVVPGFVPLLSQVGEDFVRRARAQARQSGRECWTADFSHELFRFALECECHGGPKNPPKAQPRPQGSAKSFSPEPRGGCRGMSPLRVRCPLP